ncbi:MAG: YesL family protein [Clostridiaceae bacterium]|nr:YesL family protein [Clostridiaceae bacterium]
MARLFGYNYAKEGPGVDPNEPPKGPIATFFIVLGRKFWKIITVNLMYIIGNLPMLVISFFATGFLFIGWLFPNFTPELIRQVLSFSEGSVQGMNSEELEQAMATLFLYLNVVISFTLTGMGWIVVGPSQAGLTYIMRNYAREEHAFLWMDFRDTFKENWKQSTVHSLLSLLMVFLIMFSAYFYRFHMPGGTFSFILQGMLLVVALIATSMQLYAYQMMITIDLPMKGVWKNSLLFSVFRLPFNLIIVILELVILAVIPMLLLIYLQPGPLIVFFYYLFFAFGVNLLMVNTFTNRQIMRFIITPMKEREAEEAAALLEEDYDDEYDDEYEQDDEYEDDEYEDEEYEGEAAGESSESDSARYEPGNRPIPAH